MLQAMAYGSSVKTAQSSASMARRAEFQQIAAKKFDAALNERELHVFMASLKHVIRARVGFTATARKTGLNRTALYRILSSRGNPKLSTLVVLLSVVGLRLAVEPFDESQSGKSTSVGFDCAVSTRA